MDPIQYATNSTIYRIPIELLREGFKSFYNTRGMELPINFIVPNEIYKHVIQANILPDCNVMGGKIKDCLLTEDMKVPTTDLSSNLSLMRFSNSIYRIPPEEREHRDITRVISVNYESMHTDYSVYNLGYNSSSLINNARNMLGGQTMNDRWSPPSAEIIGIDMVRLIASMVNHTNLVLEFEIAYPPTLHNITKSSLIPFCDMVLFATQMFLYNNLAIAIDQAAARGGITIGALRDILYEYRDAGEKYQQALKIFTGTESMDTRKQIKIMQFLL